MDRHQRGCSTHTCLVCVYRWVSWHHLQSSVTTVRTHPQNLPDCTRVFGFFLTIAFHFSCPSHTIALKWNFVFRNKYTLRVPQLVWPVSRHQSVSPCQTLRDRTTTGPGWRPWSEHAGAEKSGISLSGNFEQPYARLAGETTLKCHRAQNGKNNLVNKRRQPVQVQQCKLLNKWSFVVTFTLSCTTLSHMILLTVMQQ